MGAPMSAETEVHDLFKKFDDTGKAGDFGAWLSHPDIRESQMKKVSFVLTDGTTFTLDCTTSEPYKEFTKALKAKK